MCENSSGDCLNLKPTWGIMNELMKIIGFLQHCQHEKSRNDGL